MARQLWVSGKKSFVCISFIIKKMSLLMMNVGECEKDAYWDAESQFCTKGPNAQAVCFKCPAKKVYSLSSVPYACSQYIQCFNDKPTLYGCSGNLVFDGRPGVHQCNFKPPNVDCYREDSKDLESSTCPAIKDGPIFLTDKSDVYGYVNVFSVMIWINALILFEYIQQILCLLGARIPNTKQLCQRLGIQYWRRSL